MYNFSLKIFWFRYYYLLSFLGSTPFFKILFPHHLLILSNQDLRRTEDPWYDTGFLFTICSIWVKKVNSSNSSLSITFPSLSKFVYVFMFRQVFVSLRTFLSSERVSVGVSAWFPRPFPLSHRPCLVGATRIVLNSTPTSLSSRLVFP